MDILSLKCVKHLIIGTNERVKAIKLSQVSFLYFFSSLLAYAQLLKNSLLHIDVAPDAQEPMQNNPSPFLRT
jgi:hypothetical protein